MIDLGDTAAEASLIACALHSNEAIDYAAQRIDSTDFTDPKYAAVWGTIVAMRDRGAAVNHVTVGSEPGVLVDRQTLARFELAGPAAAAGLADYVAALVRLTSARRVIETSTLGARRVHDGHDPVEVSDWMATELAQVDRAGVMRLPATFSTSRDFVALPPTEAADELIPGLIRRDWRIVIVAPEGLGKSVLLRSLAGYAAYGLHPFDTRKKIRPIRALVVDLENPDEALRATFTAIMNTGDHHGVRDDDRLWLWRQRDGINIRQRTDYATLEAVIADARPDLVCIGPAYKLFHTRPGEDAETVAADVLNRLDKLRARHSFGLAIETHAPHGVGPSRELRPFGSSTWLRWPEIGLSMVPKNKPGPEYQDHVDLHRWRGDRVRNAWPSAVAKGKHRLWEDVSALQAQREDRYENPF